MKTPEQKNGIRILIIEDEALIADEIQSSLELLGYVVVGRVMNGDRALDTIAHTRPDLILLDIHIRGSRDGIALAQVIRDTYRLPFLFLTAYADQATWERAKRTTPYGYILKPFNEGTLRVNLEMALFKYRSENREGTLDRRSVESTYKTSLSDREYSVLEAFVKGLSYKKTADKCCISVNTVKSHQKKLYQIFEVSSKADLVQKLLHQGTRVS